MAALLANALLDLSDDVSLTFYHCEDDLISPPFHGLKKFASRQINAGLARVGGSALVIDFGVANRIIELSKDADILHIHNLHGYYVNWLRLLGAWRNRPIVWTWHDQWGATGRCGFSFECSKWLMGCQHCPHLDYYPAAYIDKAASEYAKKTELYGSLKNLTVVSPSAWLGEIALKRGFSAESVHVIPNPVDLVFYKVSDMIACRRQLGIPIDDFVALFVAADCDDKRKGYEDFSAVTHGMNVSAIAVGKLPKNISAHIDHAGEERNQRRLALYYGAADALILTSKADNYPNTVIESLMCGTPIIAYDVGGVGSQLDSLYSKLIPYGDIEAMKRYMSELKLSGGKSPEVQSKLHDYAREKWSSRRIAKEYYDLYLDSISSAKIGSHSN